MLCTGHACAKQDLFLVSILIFMDSKELIGFINIFGIEVFSPVYMTIVTVVYNNCTFGIGVSYDTHHSYDDHSYVHVHMIIVMYT